MATTRRQEKVSEHLRKLAAQFFGEHSNKSSLITVTKSTISKNFTRSTIFITVFPEDKREEALLFTRRKLPEFREFVKPNFKAKTLPFFDIEIDQGELNRQKIDDLTKE